MEELLKELNSFLGKAMSSTYAGGGSEIVPKEAGLKNWSIAKEIGITRIVTMDFFSLGVGK